MENKNQSPQTTQIPIQNTDQPSNHAINHTNPFPKSTTSLKLPKLIIIFLILVTLVALALAAYFFSQNQKLNRQLSQPELTSTESLQNSATQSATTDPTADWQTYTNEKYKGSRLAQCII